MRRPVQIGCIIFRKAKEYEFLLMKRIKIKGDYWQCVTGGVEDDESTLDAAYRETFEETGIKKEGVIRIVKDFFECEFETESFNKLFGKRTVIKTYEFAFQVNNNQKIKLDPIEHDEYKWLNFKDAIKLLKWDNNKNALRELNKLLI